VKAKKTTAARSYDGFSEEERGAMIELARASAAKIAGLVARAAS
jgi:hypothetical protein